MTNRAAPMTVLLISLAMALACAVVPAGAGGLCVVFPVQDLSAPGSASPDDAQSITDAVAAAATASGLTLVPTATWQGAARGLSLDPARVFAQSAAVAAARAAGADLAVTGSFSVADGDVYYSIQCWDTVTGTLASGVQETTPFNLAFFTALSQKLNAELFPTTAARGPEKTPRVVFSSPDEGMEILISGDTSIGRIIGGQASWPIAGLPQDTKVTVVKRKAGYHTDAETVTLRIGEPIPLAPLAPAHAQRLEINETFGQLLGAGAAYRAYIIPDWLYLSEGAYLWLQPPGSLALRVVFHADLNVGIGGYVWFPPASCFRMGLGANAGVIFTGFSAPGFPVFTDLYVTAASFSLEASFARMTFYLRTDLRYSLGMGENLLGQGWLLESGPQITLGMLLP